MHSLTKKEESSVLKILLAHSGEPYSTQQGSAVADLSAEAVCGWRAVRPCAEYDCRVGSNKQSVQRISERSAQRDDRDPLYPYMSGCVDDDFSYVYKGGLSTPVDLPKHFSLPQRHYHRQTIVLEPVQPYRSAQMEQTARDELARIVALQLKPEIMLEQLIIENRLRTTSLHALPAVWLGEVRYGGSRKPTMQNKTDLCSVSFPEPHKQRRKQHRVKPRPVGWLIQQTDSPNMPLMDATKPHSLPTVAPFLDLYKPPTHVQDQMMQGSRVKPVARQLMNVCRLCGYHKLLCNCAVAKELRAPAGGRRHSKNDFPGTDTVLPE